MSGHRFVHMMGSRLPPDELDAAAELLSQAYTRWQQSPKNTNPIETDTSPPVYRELMLRDGKETLLYYETAEGGSDQLCGAFVHSMTPDYDQFPLRKLSYIAVRPRERGFEPLKAAFSRYVAYMRSQGEDVVITTDLDQTTLNDLLQAAGFTECTDRNETYYILSRRLFRPVLAQLKLADDFVVDEIIHCAGKSIRRNKKLFKLQTSPLDFYEVYRRQQESRLARSVPPQNVALLKDGFTRFQEGVFFISDFSGALTMGPLGPGDSGALDAAGAGNASLRRGLLGHEGKALKELLPRMIDPDQGVVRMLPGSETELRALAARETLRPGLFDFLTYAFKILGSFIVATDAPKPEVLAVLERFPHPHLTLRYLDLVETVYAPDATFLPESTSDLGDGLQRTACRLTGDHVRFGQGSCSTDADLIMEEILALRGASTAPVVFFGHDPAGLCGLPDGRGLKALYRVSRERRVPVLVFDFGYRLSDFAMEHLQGGSSNPHFSMVTIRDFYQAPVMLELLGLSAQWEPDMRF